jgi:hypothetical protein
VHHLGVAGQRRGADPGGLLPHPLEDVLRTVDHPPRHRVGHRLHDNQIAEAFQQIGGEPPRVVAGVYHRLDGPEQRGGVPGGQRVYRDVDQRDVRRTQQRQGSWVGDPIALRTGQQLVEHRQRVAGRATAGPDDQRIHRVVDGYVLLRADAFQ